MSTKLKLIVAAAIAVLGLPSPASAQSFNRSDGTGNELPSYYDNRGGLHAGVAIQLNQTATHRSGLYAFASVPRAAAGHDKSTKYRRGAALADGTRSRRPNRSQVFQCECAICRG